ncbi:hypothetical protein, partial [Pseudomonas aeruginosa]
VIPVALTAVAEKRSRLFVTYADTVREDKTKRQSFTHLERGRIPVVVGHNGKQDVALAVWQGKTALPVQKRICNRRKRIMTTRPFNS